MPIGVIFISAAILLIGAAPLPYGYYTLLRLVACCVFAFASFVSFERNYKVLPWVFGLLALVFNPIIPVHLPKEVWVIVDVVSGFFLVAATNSIKTKNG